MTRFVICIRILNKKACLDFNDDNEFKMYKSFLI